MNKKPVKLPEVEESFITKKDLLDNNVLPDNPVKFKPSKIKKPVVVTTYIEPKDLLKEKFINFKNFVIGSLIGKSCQDCGIDDIKLLEYDYICQQKSILNCLAIPRTELQTILDNSNVRCLNCQRQSGNI